MRSPAIQFALLLAACLVIGGCVSADHANTAQRQNQALADPMNYSPSVDNTDITGGDLGHYDDQAMKRDVDDFWNP